MLELNSAEKIFRTKHVETVALNGINLHVQRSEFLAIQGPSGCGKSTLLAVLGLLDTLSSGSFSFNGLDISSSNEAQLAKLRREYVSYVFQDFHLLGNQNALQNVMMALRFKKLSKSEKMERSLAALDRVGLSHRSRHRPHQLSGGQQQRVAIARAIVKEPLLILADEPTGNLDSKLGSEVMELLASINNDGSTIVMVTHSSRDADFAKSVAKMDDGQIINVRKS